MAGYSNRRLVDKLGLKSGMALLVIQPPEHYQALMEPMPSDVIIGQDIGLVDFVHLFVTSLETLEAEFSRAKERIKRSGMLWISWPKRSSKILTDLDENIIREVGLKHGLVDVKVCAIDDNWSGLKFVYRLADRH
jgi:hypothetical protein